MSQPQPSLKFSESEIGMLGSTADALSAYMGAAVLAEVGDTDGAQWVIFARALDQRVEPAQDIVHVQMGGPGSLVLGQRGGLPTDQASYDCELLWAIEITEDPENRFVRLTPQGEAFDAAMELAELLPFSLVEPEVSDEEHEDQDDEPSDSINDPK